MGLSEIYKESIHYEGMPIRQQGAWAFVDRFGAQVAFDRVWRDDETFTDIKGVEREEIKPEGNDSLYDYFYYLHKQAFPGIKFLYLDVSSGNPSGYESRWTGMKSIEKFREYDWAYFSEMPNNYVNYDPHNDASTSGVNTRYNNWYTFAEFEAYGTPAVIEDNEADVEAAVNALTWDVIKGGNADQESITADLVLPTEGENGTAIAWSSDSTDVISDQGVVTRPAEEDRTVTLTATVTKGEASAVKTFTVTVLAETKPEPEQTPAPEFVQTTAQFPDEASNSVSFTLKNAAAAVYKVYAAAEGGEVLTEPAVTVEGENLTLTFAAQPDADTVYCISAAEADKTESVRTAVTVKPYVEEVEEVIPPVTEYIIKAEAEMGGTISPDGSVRVPSGGSKTFAIAANEGYEIADVLVDGVSVGAVSTYTFERVEKKHTIVARFKPAGGGETEGFGDVASGAWYAEAVAYVSDNGIMNGTSATTFAPEMTLTRSMMAQILYNLEKQPAVTSANPFSDVPAGQWYTNAVVWAAANDIVTGYNGKFQPDASITREQMAAILYRYAQYKGYDTSAKGSLENFSDAAAASDWANEALTWAVGEGILSGKGNGVLNPVGTAARAEVAAMLMRFCENIEK